MGERIHVTIFGAGVAGLSAAHELIERGFGVTVVEKRENPLNPGQCHVGGMARTQWARVRGDEFVTGPLDARMVRTRPPVSLTVGLRERSDLWYSRNLDRGMPGALEREKPEVRFAEGRSELDPTAEQRIDVMADRLKQYVRDHVVVGADGKPVTATTGRKVPSHLVEQLYVEGYRDGAETDRNIGTDRALAVKRRLDRLLDEECHANGWKYSEVVELAVHDVGSALQDDWTLAASARRIVRLRMQETLLPGEHGYRFFPAFYRHLFDTMKRTPILEEKWKTLEEFSQTVAIINRSESEYAGRGPRIGRYWMETARTLDRFKLVETGQTAFDSIVSVNYHSIGQADRLELPEILPRSQPTSLREAMAAFLSAQDELGFEMLDLARYQLKVLEYVTMCAERRRELAEVSWADFIEIDTYSEQFQKVMDIWPQALIGMRAYEADAQTSGNISVQMMLDQLRAGGFRDGTLNGPTSVVWLDPWRRYLQDQGVEFVNDELKSIELGTTGKPISVTRFDGRLEQATSGYVVLALPVEEAQRIVADFGRKLGEDAPSVRAKEFEGTDLQRVADFLHWDATLATQDKPDGPLQHFSGIQYYLEQDHSLVRGHTYFANSPWGVTSISQAQFRVDRPDWRQQYRGILSVDIGSCYDSGRKGPSVWKSTADQVAREIWEQMNDAIGVEEQKLPDPLWYHIDDDLEFKPDRSGTKLNHTPYLLSRPKEFAKRPGRLSAASGLEYDVTFRDKGDFRGIVLAGSYMKTFTRLATMESANESARHAVNAIIRDCRRSGGAGFRAGQLCPTWNPEDDEFHDLAWLKDLDRRLHERKLPHLLKVLDLDGMLGSMGGDPMAQLGRLIEALSRENDFPRSLLKLGAPHSLLRSLADVLTGRSADA